MIYFVAPPVDAFVSGGNLFNQQIITALLATGHVVDHIDLHLLRGIDMGEKDLVIIDSIYLNAIHSIEIKSFSSNIYLLVHLLPSMIGEGSIDVEKKLLRIFDRLIVNSDFSKDYCQEKIGYPGEIRVLQPYIKKTKTSVIPVDRSRIIMVCTWQPVKQLAQFLTTLARHDLPGDLEIEFFGDTTLDENYFRHCIGLIEDNPHLKPHIKIKGHIPHDDLLDIYQNTKLMIDVASFESFGMAVAEGLAAQVPILSLGNGNIKNLIDRGEVTVCQNMNEVILNMIAAFNKEMTPMKSSETYTESWSEFVASVKAAFNFDR